MREGRASKSRWFMSWNFAMISFFISKPMVASWQVGGFHISIMRSSCWFVSLGLYQPWQPTLFWSVKMWLPLGLRCSSLATRLPKQTTKRSSDFGASEASACQPLGLAMKLWKGKRPFHSLKSPELWSANDWIFSANLACFSAAVSDPNQAIKVSKTLCLSQDIMGLSPQKVWSNFVSSAATSPLALSSMKSIIPLTSVLKAWK
mmetsp:Transcript_66961/g.145513  ORF Transcript_66961/g.145513 Transcript_66961/m.145513 type:complete len:204 (-) Transcript_66961:621-1232(-)